MSSGELLDRSAILDLFAELDRRLVRRRVRGRVYVVGGAAIALAYDTSRATRDIDALVDAGHGPLMEEVRAVARERRLPGTWLNEQASAYIAGGDTDAVPAYEGRGLSVAVGSARHLLAMKARAARARDVDDIRLLADQLGIGDAAGVVAVAEDVFGEPLSGDRRLVVEDALGDEGRGARRR